MIQARNLTMIGTGYVGLVSGTCFAEMGFNVTCVDVDQTKIDNLKNEGIIPIYEPGLEEMVKRNAKAGRLHFTTDLASVVANSDAIFIAVGTPQDEDGSADLQYVKAAAEQLAPHLKGYTVIVNKSTVPVGTGQLVEDAIRAANLAADFDVASNPEFLREGEALGDFMHPDRVVVGVENDRARAMMASIYKPQTDNGVTLHVTNRASSELIKYAANAFLATKITFINELISLCDKVGADILSVSRGMGLDSRIAPRFLQPGPGYGGSCFPKDTNALAKTARDYGVQLNLVEETIRTNQSIKEQMADRIAQNLGGVSGKTIAVLGLAFKANTDDMRDASALTILPRLQSMGAKIVAYDPAAMPRAKQLMPTLTYVGSTEEALQGADSAVILTEWADFRNLNLGALKSTLTESKLVDLRNLFTVEEAKAAGLHYFPLGRPA